MWCGTSTSPQQSCSKMAGIPIYISFNPTEAFLQKPVGHTLPASLCRNKWCIAIMKCREKNEDSHIFLRFDIKMFQISDLVESSSVCKNLHKLLKS